MNFDGNVRREAKKKPESNMNMCLLSIGGYIMHLEV